MTYASSLRSGSAPDAREIKETESETSIRGFIRLLPLVRPYVSRFSNATSDARGMPRTFTKWQLPQLWYSRRAIVAGFMDRQSRPTRCCLEVGDFRQASLAVARSSAEAPLRTGSPPKGTIGTPP